MNAMIVENIISWFLFGSGLYVHLVIRIYCL